MPQLLTSRHDKSATLDEIERIVDRHVAVGCTPEQLRQLHAHMAKLRADPRPLTVACRFETIPALTSTRIILDISYTALPSIPPIRQ